MRVRDMDPETLLAIARECEKDALYWKACEKNHEKRAPGVVTIHRAQDRERVAVLERVAKDCRRRAGLARAARGEL
jgi:hypothetical protein